MNNTNQVYTKTLDLTGAIIEATDPGGTIKYDYYSSGNLKSVIAPSCTTTVEYDKYQKQKKIVDPNAGIVNSNIMPTVKSYIRKMQGETGSDIQV